MALLWNNISTASQDQDLTVFELPNHMVINNNVHAKDTLVPQFMQYVEILGKSVRGYPNYPPVIARKFFMYPGMDSVYNGGCSADSCNSSTFDHNQNLGKTMLLSNDGTQIFITAPTMLSAIPLTGTTPYIITLNASTLQRVKTMTGLYENGGTNNQVGHGSNHYIWLLEDLGTYVSYIRSGSGTATNAYTVIQYGLYNKATGTSSEVSLPLPVMAATWSTAHVHIQSVSAVYYFVTVNQSCSVTGILGSNTQVFSINKTTSGISSIANYTSTYQGQGNSGTRPSQSFLKNGTTSTYYFYTVAQQLGGTINLSRFEYDHNTPSIATNRYEVGGNIVPFGNAGVLPGTLCGSSVVTTYNNAYLFGGSTTGTAGVTTTYTAPYPALSTSILGTWVAGTAIPGALAFSSPAVTSAGVYLLGGYNATAVTNVVYYAPISAGAIGTWTTGTALPTAVYASQAIVTSTGIYLIGGNNGTVAVATVWYAPLTAGVVGTWSVVTGNPLPSPLAGSQAVVTSTGIYMVGGYSGANNTTAVSTIFYAPITNGVLGTWTTVTSLPAALSSSQVSITNTGVYMLGGHNGTAATTIVYYAPITNGLIGTWTTFGIPLQTAVYSGMAITSTSFLSLMGGYTGSASVASGYVYNQCPSLGTYTSSNVKGLDASFSQLVYTSGGACTGFASFLITPTSGNLCLGIILEEGPHGYAQIACTTPISFFQMYIYQLNDSTGLTATLKSVIPVNYKCRGVFPLDANYQNIILIFDTMLQFMTFDNANLTYTISSQLNLALGGGSFCVDSSNRLWVMENTGALSLMTPNVPTRVSISFADANYSYNGTPINTSINVSAYDQFGARQTVSVTVLITSSNALFTGNSLSTITITTSSSTDTNIPITINAAGYVKLSANVGI